MNAKIVSLYSLDPSLKIDSAFYFCIGSLVKEGEIFGEINGIERKLSSFDRGRLN